MEYQFEKKELRTVGATVIRCGSHWAIVYKQLGQWKYRVGFEPVAGEFIPSDQYSYGVARTKAGAIVHAESEILGHGPDGVDWMGVSVVYNKWGSQDA